MNDDGREPLKNKQHEKVVQAIAGGASNRAAYMAAYPRVKPASADAAVARLLGDARVIARLNMVEAEQREIAADRRGVDVDWLLAQGQEILRRAIRGGELQAANAALERLAKISGNWVDQSASVSDSVQRIYSSEPLSEEQWTEQHVPKPANQARG